MATRLQMVLEEGERLLWERQPSGDKVGRAALVVQILGHVLLTSMSVLFALAAGVGILLQVLLGVILCLSTNGPLVAWSLTVRPKMARRGDAVFFVTDRRVGLLRPSGELRQAPIRPALVVDVHAQTIEFKVGETTGVSFGGLKADELRLLSVLVEGLVKNSAQ